MEFNALRYQDPATLTFLGSPSLVRLPDGQLLASHDYFGPGCPLNHEHEEHLTSVYRSADNGRTWQSLTHVANAFWSSLFVHRGAVYLLGTSQQYGSIVIRRSTDSGCTWTRPRDETSGLLFPGGFYHDPPNYHCAPVPVVVANDRVFRAFEDCSPCSWGRGFKSCVISAAEDADLLQAENWRMTNKLATDPDWAPASWETPVNLGWLEGNVVVTPAGELWNILRVHSDPNVNKAAIVRISPDGRTATFDPKHDFIDFPGGTTKFTIRRDPVSGRYLSLVNTNVVPTWPNQRNRLDLAVSWDLRNWEVVHPLLEDDLETSLDDSLRRTGFQYVDWQFDGEDDLMYLVRTAYDGARNFHDSNRITFHRLEGFRRYLP
jgi:hypothetical protein